MLRALSVEQTMALAAGLLLAGAALALAVGLRHLQQAPHKPFYLLRREASRAGWRLLLLAVGFAALAAIVRGLGPTTVFHYVAPTPTRTGTPTITLTPTITPTASQTPLPSTTPTPGPTHTLAPTPTPHLPPVILQSFTGIVTPQPKAVISPVTAAKFFTHDFRPLTDTNVFFNPLQRMNGFFSYDNMTDGVQWTAIWYREGTVVYYESKPWDGGPGGYGFTQWDVSPDYFLPGGYEIQIFVGTEWRASGTFTVVGPAPTGTPTAMPSLTPTASLTPTITATRAPTLTPSVTNTRMPTATAGTQVPPTSTAAPSLTPSPTQTRWPTATS